MSAQLPPSTITTEEVRFSRTEIEKKPVHSWFCECGNQLGKFSAERSWELYGKIICGECAQKEDLEYQKWLMEQEA